MGQMRGRDQSIAVASRVDRLVGSQPPRRTIGKVVQVHERADLGADRLRLRRLGEPLVQRAAFVDFEVAPADPPQCGRVDDLCDRLTDRREHPAHARVKQERLLVADDEVIELQVDFGNEHGNPE